MRTKNLRIGLLFASLVTLIAACGQVAVVGGEGEDKPDDSQLVKQELQLSSRVHKMPKLTNAPVQQATVNAHLTYYGGKIIPAVKAISVNWGSTVNSTVTAGMPGFYGAITQSNMWDWLATEYTTVGLNGNDGQPGSNQAFVHGTSGGSITITPAKVSGTIDDTAIQTEISNQIASGKLPAPDDNTYYGINFPKGLTITQGGSSSCVQFCAYHGTFVRNGQNVYYGVLPSIEAGTGCETGCGSSPTMFQNYTSVASHELVEAVTDAEVGVATVVGRPLAWYDSTNGEIGDICNANQGTITASNGTVYTVQTEFDNLTQNCIVTKNVGGGTGGGGGSTGGGAGGGSGGGATGGGSGGGSTGGGTGGGSTGGGTGGGTGDVVLGNGVAVTGLSGATGAQSFFRIDVPTGATNLTFTISGGSGDADLYTKLGAHPSLTSYDCRPYLTGNSETCTVAAPAAGSYYVMLNGYAAFTGVSLTAQYTTGGGGGDPVLAIGQSIANLSGTSGSTKFYQINVPAGTNSLTVAIKGSTSASNDADLYVRAGAHPTTTTYDCRPYKTGSNESCTFSAPSGTYYVMLRGYTAYSGVTVSAK